MVEKGTLFVVATPIGNMGDMTYRAVETLRSVDIVLSEDTRVTKKLLTRYEVSKPLISFHEHTDRNKAAQLVARLQAGEKMALVTDAGTPGLSDPGNVLVALARVADVPVVPIPGASALTALVSVAGTDMREFVFKGFPPHKKGRETFFRFVAESSLPVVYYESPHRFLKNLALLQELAPQKNLVVGRELTKVFEEIFSGSVSEALAHWQESDASVKGEFTIIAS